jgi:hypothetical protein
MLNLPIATDRAILSEKVPVFIDSPQITRLYQEMDDSWDRGAGSSESPQIRT